MRLLADAERSMREQSRTTGATASSAAASGAGE